MWKYPKYPKNPKYPRSFSENSVVNGERIKEKVALVILVILADGWYKDVL